MLRHRCASLLLTAIASSCASLDPRGQANLDLFDCYWQALNDGYPFFAQKHIDWHALGQQYRAAVVFARGPSQLYHLVAGMLSELQDPHVSLEIPEANWREDGVAAVSLTDGKGFRFVVCGRRMYVQSWPDGEAPVPPDRLDAAAASWPEIVAIEGYPMSWSVCDVLFRGAPGSPCELRLRWSDGRESRHVVRRPDATRKRTVTIVHEGKEIEVEIGKLLHGFDQRVGVERRGRWATLRIDSLSASNLQLAPEKFVARLDAVLDEAAASDGMILDLRQNGGGDAAAAAAIAGRFFAEEQLSVLGTENTSWLFGLFEMKWFSTLTWDARPPRIEKPLVVLTSWRTGSAAEHLARLLQRTGAAIVVGERTAGAEAFLERVPGPEGSELVYGRGRAMEVSGRGFQDDGVIPDVLIDLTIEDVQRCGSFEAARKEWDEQLFAAAEAALASRSK